MHLVVVYGLKTLDYGYFKLFYPSRRLAEECANRSIPLRFLFPRDILSFIAEQIDIGLKRDTICLIRGKVDPKTVSLLEMAGFRTVNSADALSLANDKLASARFLSENSWPTPKTMLACDALYLKPGFIRYPLVAKPRFGNRGEGVHFIENESALTGLEPDTIVQEYIKTSRGRDLRFFFAGDTILAIASRHATGDSFVSNANAGGIMQKEPHTAAELAPWSTMTLEIAQKAGLWYGSVDYLYCGKQEDAHTSILCGQSRGPALELTVCEINGSPGFEALETDCALDIAGPLIDRLTDYLGAV